MYFLCYLSIMSYLLNISFFLLYNLLLLKFGLENFVQSFIVLLNFQFDLYIFLLFFKYGCIFKYFLKFYKLSILFIFYENKINEISFIFYLFDLWLFLDLNSYIIFQVICMNIVSICLIELIMGGIVLYLIFKGFVFYVVY